MGSNLPPEQMTAHSGTTVSNSPLSRNSWGDTYTPPKLGDPCQKCRKRPSTHSWIGDGGGLALSHGFYQLWCDVCVFTEQLKHAKAAARRVPVLERKLARAKARKR